jgi:hypothetical protein
VRRREACVIRSEPCQQHFRKGGGSVETLHLIRSDKIDKFLALSAQRLGTRQDSPEVGGGSRWIALFSLGRPFYCRCSLGWHEREDVVSEPRKLNHLPALLRAYCSGSRERAEPTGAPSDSPRANGSCKQWQLGLCAGKSLAHGASTPLDHAVMRCSLHPIQR